MELKQCPWSIRAINHVIESPSGAAAPSSSLAVQSQLALLRVMRTRATNPEHVNTSTIEYTSKAPWLDCQGGVMELE